MLQAIYLQYATDNWLLQGFLNKMGNKWMSFA
jgi:hypothetical protein